MAAFFGVAPGLHPRHAAVFAVGKGVALRCRDGRAASRRARQFAQKAGFVGWAHANKRFKIASDDSDDD